MLCTAGLYELGFEFEDNGLRGGRCIESDGIERQRIEGPGVESKIREEPSPSGATINVNLTAVHDGRGREEYANHRLKSGMTKKLSDPANQRRTLGVKSRLVQRNGAQTRRRKPMERQKGPAGISRIEEKKIAP